jgi:tripartite-type tricarboxylate transporter receptor subunit TctC
MSYPEKSIRIILPFGSPGFSSRVGFALQPFMAEYLGEDVYFEHITGGFGGSNGPSAAAAADADGYTLFMGTIGNMALLPTILPDYAIDPLEDLTQIIKLADTPNILVAHPSLGINNLEGLKAAARAKPGTLKYHGINARSIHMLEFKSLIEETGMDLVEISPDSGSEGAIAAILSGDIDLTITTGPRLLNDVNAGNVIALAAICPSRVGAYSDVPTMMELGLKTTGSGSWMSLSAPSGVSDEIVETIFQAAKKASEQPRVHAELSEQAMVINASASPQEARTFIEQETERLNQASIAAGLI